jgi:ribonuclease BN (tRNA processing enzyme)
MIIKFLGAHNTESKKTKLVTILIDNIIAIDAGSLTSELTFLEQKRIKAILLSHGHYDHTKEVPSFAFSNSKQKSNVYGSSETLRILASHLFDGIIYPKLNEKTPFANEPPLKLVPLDLYKTVNIKDYKVMALPINHTIDAIGFYISSQDGKKIFYTGDTGSGLSDIWKLISPQLIIADTTFPNELENVAKDSAHLCPKLLKNELLDFYRIKGYFPKIILVHLDPKYEEEIKNEIKEVSNELNHPISIASEGKKLII